MLQEVTAHSVPNNDMVKIGIVAKHLGISIRTIHMYEREGLFIAYKNHAGTRYFSARDVQWLEEIRKMIKSSISIAGMRALMALIPCWEEKQCKYRLNQDCPAITDHSTPCWSNKKNKCGKTGQECRECQVYEMRFSVGSLKSVVDIKLKNPKKLPSPSH